MAAHPEKQHKQKQGESKAVAPSSGQSMPMVPRSPAPVPGRIGSLFRQMEEEMNQMMSSFGMPGLALDPFASRPGEALAVPDMPGALGLAVDIKETGDAFVLTADVPGVNKDAVKITVTPDNVLTISGERKHEAESEDTEIGFHRIERSWGFFSRSFKLPPSVKAEDIQAKVEEGVLKLTMPKSGEHHHKEIKVAVE